MAETPDRTPTRSCSVREMASGSNLFVIQGYSMAKGVGVGNHIASEEFTMAGCKWALYFYPDGRSEEDKLDFISVFLSLKSNAEDFPLLLELTLMDLSGKGEHLVKMCSEKSVLSLQSRGSMWGYNDFFRRSGLETSDFLRDDCLKIFCNVVADLSVGSNIGMLLEDMEGDDSEHKDVFTGDDGIDPEKCEDLAPKIKQDDENMDEAGEEGELSKSGKELMELLPRPANRPNDSDADDKDNDDDMEDIPLKAIPSAAGCGTPSASKSSKVASKCSGEGSKTLNNAPLEKANEEDELPVKDEKVVQHHLHHQQVWQHHLTGPVTEDEIKAFLPLGTPVAVHDISNKFKVGLNLKEDKDAFLATFRRITTPKMINGILFMVRER